MCDPNCDKFLNINVNKIYDKYGNHLKQNSAVEPKG